MDTPNSAGQRSQTPPQGAPKTSNHAGDHTLMGVLSYLGPLVIISYLAKKDDPFVKFHIKQGLVLISIQVILWIISSMVFLWSFWPIYRVIHLALFILAIIGIVNVIQGKQKELPLVGGFSHYFKF